MKKLSKLLLPSIAIMLVAVMSLTGVTYAWFQDSQNAKVDQLNASVVSADGIMVSWDAAEWDFNLSFSDATYSQFSGGGATGYTNVNDANFKFSPVSTSGIANSNGKLDMFEAVLTDDAKIQAIVQAGDPSSTPTKYVQYDIYFRVFEETTVTLAALSVDDMTSQTSIARASRVAFIDQGFTTSTDPTAARALKAAEAVSIFEPNALLHTTAGLELQKSFVPTAVQGQKFDYYGFSALYSESTPLEQNPLADTDYMKKVTTTNSKDDISFTFGAGVNKLSVYVWIEGQDADCNSDLSGTQFKMNMEFAAAATAQD